MSRHLLHLIHDGRKLTVVAGYDRPLRELYLHVIHDNDARAHQEETFVYDSLGDPGLDWTDINTVVDRLKVPLLVEPDEDGGTAILTNCLLRLIAWDSGRDLYRHPAYQVPGLAIQRAPEQLDLPWQVLHDGTVVACFSDIGKAGAYLAFMCGETVEPRVFQ